MRLSPLLALLPLPAVALVEATQASDPVLDAMQVEMDRAMGALATEQPPPYFLSLQTVESRTVRIQAEEGGLQGYFPQVQRHVDVDVRVGSPQLDSTHPLRGGTSDIASGAGRNLPLTDDPTLLRQGLWREIDRRFLSAQERWAKVDSDRQVLVGEAPSWDLAPAEPYQDLEPVTTYPLDFAHWEALLRASSAVLAASPVSYDGSVQLLADQAVRRYTDTGGTRYRDDFHRFVIRATVDTVADDGASLALARSWESRDPARLPDAATVTAEVQRLDRLLTDLRKAPLQDPYSGPVILSDRAAGVFFHEILGHRLEGERLKRIDDAQTLKDQVGQAILPPFLSLVDDPTLTTWSGRDLMGHYRHDDEGVRAQRVDLVKDGVLQGFLQSRSPSDDKARSNGHGRRQPGYAPTARQGNLIVTASKSVTDAQLRDELKTLARKAGLAYGLYVDEIEGGFTLTGRRIPNAFTVDVLVAYRVYVDGRPDELVRGIDLIGTPLVTLSRIVRAGESHAVFNGTCGAESGGVPVSAVAPSLLVSLLETQRKVRSQMTPALLPPPLPPTQGGGETPAEKGE